MASQHVELRGIYVDLTNCIVHVNNINLHQLLNRYFFVFIKISIFMLVLGYVRLRKGNKSPAGIPIVSRRSRDSLGLAINYSW